MLMRRLLPVALLATCMFAIVPAALAQTTDPSFRLNNRSAVTINEVYVSSANDSGWGSDRLGQDVLSPGQTLIIRLPQGQCMNDLRVVFANGQSLERRRVDTCQITDYNIQ